MKVRAYYKSINPFRPNIEDLRYSKTVDVPEGTDMEVLEKFAIEDTRSGYVFDKIEEV
ncbi:MAG: hypothetical protein HQ522_16285 [Bacteroidetes bacterium]|nr:hypothetical protein [Bacteroidota bacterium]